MTLWLPRRIYQSKFPSPSYPGQSESLLRTDGLDRLTDKIEQRMKVSISYSVQLIARSNELYQI